MGKLSICLGGDSWTNYDKTKYFKREDKEGILRIANHYANANEFASKGEFNGNVGLVFRMEERGKIFRKDSRVHYREEVYLAQHMNVETEMAIIDGLIDWIQNDNFSCPIGIATHLSP